MRPKGVTDAQQFNITALRFVSMGGRFPYLPASYGYNVGHAGMTDRQIRQSLNLGVIASLSQDEQGEGKEGQEKPLRLGKMDPYRKPTQVSGHVNMPRRTREPFVKELGKKVAVTSG